MHSKYTMIDGTWFAVGRDGMFPLQLGERPRGTYIHVDERGTERFRDASNGHRFCRAPESLAPTWEAQADARRAELVAEADRRRANSEHAERVALACDAARAAEMRTDRRLARATWTWVLGTVAAVATPIAAMLVAVG